MSPRPPGRIIRGQLRQRPKRPDYPEQPGRSGFFAFTNGDRMLEYDLTRANDLGAYPIYKGADWAVTIDAEDPDAAIVTLTGFTFRMKVRAEAGSDEVLLELTTENGGITVDEAGGTITLILTDTATAAIDWHFASYDLERIDASGNVRRWMGGTLEAVDENTR